jgi:hypothetical protein
MCRNDAAFAELALGVIARGEYARLAVEGGKLRRKVLTHFLDETAQKSHRFLTPPMVRHAEDTVSKGIAA